MSLNQSLISDFSECFRYLTRWHAIKVANRDWVNHQVYSLSHNIHAVPDSFITND